jgi:alanyl-tRNA synthetase
MVCFRTRERNGPCMASVSEIRKSFLDFFEAREHTIVPSSSLVPQNDPTLLFSNAGMNQFKHAFTGAETRAYSRAASVQKCVRAGGKHNDLDNVGYTSRHHTFFEMLGNFSFGDYFKETAILYAWDFVTKGVDLNVDRLLVTVHPSDDEARQLWRKIAGLPDSRIIGHPENLWQMGPIGPCGFCSELFYDQGESVGGGPPGSADEDGDRFLEFWNLVFMQFEQVDEATRVPLPKPSIDTGMGLERIAAILQGVTSNYEIDLFRKLITRSEEITRVKAVGERAASHRVIADHVRSACFLMADGVTPSNEGRGYVLRRIMRRAMRHAYNLNPQAAVLRDLAPTLIVEMKDAYPELDRARAVILDQLGQEDERFRRMLGRGLSLLEEETAKLAPGGALSGDAAFKLYDTFGFPLDLTQDILRGRGQTVDTLGFDAAMERQREMGRDAWSGSGEAATGGVWLALKEKLPATTFLGYGGEAGEGDLAAIVSGGDETRALKAGEEGELVFDRTPFYGESGGQAGDRGVIRFTTGAIFTVEDTQKRAGALHGHRGRLISGAIKIGDAAALEIDHTRRARIRANHSATHLLHAALRHVLGAHVSQKGSLVEDDRFRFDFSHGQPMTAEEIERVEDEVNAVIRQNDEANIREMAPDQAIEAGALALFGEKYGDRVRVLSLGAGLEDPTRPYSVELCGGTHVRRTGDIAVFAILAEGGVAAGVRRIEAATGAAALGHIKAQAALARTLAAALKTPILELPDRVAALADERRRLERDLADARKKLALAGPANGAESVAPETIGGMKLIARVLEGVPAKDLRGLVDEGKKSIGSGVVAYVGVDQGKAALAIGVTDDLKARISAVDLVKAGVAAVGGQGGGGRADMAQGGGPDGASAPAALAAIRDLMTSAA